MSSRSVVTPRRIAVALGVVLLLWAAAVAVTGVQAARALQSVASSAQGLRDGAAAGDWAAADREADALAASARDAADVTDRWPWTVASHLPLLGDQLRAVSAAAEASHTIGQVVPAGLQELRAFEERGLVSETGEIDLATLERLDPMVQDLATRTSAARQLLQQAEQGRLLPPLRRELESASAQLAEVDGVLEQAAAVLPVLPGMLGADAPRHYLIAFTNPTEVRPVQGIVGAYGLLSVDKGRLELAAAGSDNDLYYARADPHALGPEYVARYGMDPSLVQNLTLSADASDAGRLLTDLWVDSGRDRPDGVLFLDPVGVSQMLADHPPLAIPGVGDVPVEQLPELLLHDAYVRFEGEQEARKAFLTAVTIASFGAVLEEGIDRAVVQGAADAVQAGHLIVYSEHADEQAALVQLDAAGVLPAPSHDARLYLTNADPSKLDYWLHGRAELQPSCSAGEPARISLRLQNDVPADVPEYMQRGTGDDVTTRTARRIVALYLPPDVEVVGADVDGRPVGLADRTEKGWQVQLATVDVPPSETTTITWYVGGPSDALPTSVELQPMLNSGGAHTVAACS